MIDGKRIEIRNPQRLPDHRVACEINYADWGGWTYFVCDPDGVMEYDYDISQRVLKMLEKTE